MLLYIPISSLPLNFHITTPKQIAKQSVTPTAMPAAAPVEIPAGVELAPDWLKGLQVVATSRVPARESLVEDGWEVDKSDWKFNWNIGHIA